jgi:CHAD domain-containing protein
LTTPAAGAATARGSAVLDRGDRPWSEAAASTLAQLATTVGKRAKRVRDSVDEDAVHDLRTATRRLRTALTLYGEEADAGDRKRIERVLKRISRRLGAVRDLDVLLQELDRDGSPPEAQNRGPLRRAWEAERRVNAERLAHDLGRKRFRDAVDGAGDLLTAATTTTDGPLARVASRAPGLIWDAAGNVLAYDIDPETADPATIHDLRIAAKKLRYTLEAFEDALAPGPSLVDEVTTLQDAGGEMHDAIVARDRARSFARRDDLTDRERRAIHAFAQRQDERAEACRVPVAVSLTRVQGREFREALGRAVAGMGHVRAAARA